MTPNAAIDRFIAGDRSALSQLIENYPNTRAGDQFEFRKRLGNTHKFKIAPLRNIARTGPYLHDGRYPTRHDSLRERLIAYMLREASIRDTVDLAEGELDDLVAFLTSLTGQIDQQYIATAD